MTVQYAAQMLAGGKTVEIQMYDRIGGGWFSDGITAKMVSRTLKEAGNVELIKIRMNSPGGDVWEGSTISALLSAHPARVEFDIDGLCASAATVIAVGSGDEIRIAKNAMMMLHKATTVTIGGEDQHLSAVQMLKGINQGASEIYASRTGKSASQMLAVMEAETWYTADEAVEAKLADKVTEAKKVEACWDRDELAKIFAYQHVPEQPLARPVAQQQSRFGLGVGGAGGDAGGFISGSSGQYGSGCTNTTNFPSVLYPGVGNNVPLGASPSGEEKAMSVNLNRIALALGLSEGADESAVVNMIDKLKEQRVALQGVVNEVELMTGQRGSEAIGALRGFKTAAESIPVLQAQVTELGNKVQGQERATLIRQGKDEGKLTPALITYFETRPVEELRGFLPAAPRVLDAQALQQPKGSPPTNGGSELSAKKWEELKAMEKHRLHNEDPAGYAAVKQEYEQRTGRTVGTPSA